MYKKSGTKRKKKSGTVWQLVLQNLNIELPYDPAITLLGLHSEERKQTPGAVHTPVFIAMAHTSPQMDKSQSSPTTGWNITQPLKGRHSDGCSNKNEPRRRRSKLANNQGTHSVGLHSLTVPKAVKFMETVWLAGASEGRWCWGYARSPDRQCVVAQQWEVAGATSCILERLQMVALWTAQGHSICMA